MDRLEGFSSHHGPDFCAPPSDADRIRVEHVDWSAPAQDGHGDDAVEIFWTGQPLRYRLAMD